MLKSLLREPLVHFLLLGAALFGLDAWLRPPAATAGASEIVVSEARIRNLAQNFARAWQRPPAREELNGLVESFVREEVMVREALALGLDRDDAIIRRRLQQKLEFVSEEAVVFARPTDEELSTFLQAHPEAFRREPRATFVQIYLDPGKHAGSLEADARRLIERLNRSWSAPDPARLGDSLMLLEGRYENASRADLARLFGSEFADALLKQPAGVWVGPITSGYGAHLVRIESVTPGGTPALEEVRPALEREWANAKRQELSQAFYAKLRAKYAIKVKLPEAVKP